LPFALCSCVGWTGFRGGPGATGATGLTGFQGQVGATGFQGPSGPFGFTGPVGAQGLQGINAFKYVFVLQLIKLLPAFRDVVAVKCQQNVISVKQWLPVAFG